MVLRIMATIKNRRDNEYEEETLISYIFFQSLFDGNAYNKSPINHGKNKGMINAKLKIIEKVLINLFSATDNSGSSGGENSISLKKGDTKL